MAKYVVMLTVISLILVAIETLFIFNNCNYNKTIPPLPELNLNRPAYCENYSFDELYSHDAPKYLPAYSGFGSYRTGLIVHSAYFDERPRNGYCNVTVIFITMNLTLWRNSGIVGCGIESTNASNFVVYSPMENVEAHKGLGWHKQENLLILCFDLPVYNGSQIYVYQKSSIRSNSIIRLHSEYPVLFRAPRIQPAGEDHITVATCVKVNNRHSRLLKEFILYQKTIGIDHVFIIALKLFVEDGGYHDIILNDTELNKLHKEGYISMKVWTNEKGIDVVAESEVIRKLECSYRLRGTYDYVMPIDTDDFFVPRVKGKSKLRDYIKDYCYEKPIASCQFVWVWFFPECGLTSKVGPDGNITNHLKTTAYDASRRKRLNFKSAHNLTHIMDNGFHDAECKDCMTPGYTSVIVPTHIAYIGHIRYGLRYGSKVNFKKVCKQKPFRNIHISKNTRKHLST